MEATKVVAQTIEAEVIVSKHEQSAAVAVRELTALELSMIGGGSGNVWFL